MASRHIAWSAARHPAVPARMLASQPAPAPVTGIAVPPTVMTASALQCDRARMFVSVFLGRALRFAAEALLILYFGRRFLDFINSDAFNYVVYGLTLVAVAGSAFTVYRLFWKKGRG